MRIEIRKKEKISDGPAPPLESSVATKNDDEKSVYVSIPQDGELDRWYLLNPHSGIRGQGFSFSEVPSLNFPCGLDIDNIRYYGCVAFDSKIYFIGGKSDDCYSSKVFIFDPATNTWKEGAPLNHPRAFPTVVAIGRRIYVFGCGTKQMDISVEQWAECYDLDSDAWKFLPSPPQEVFDNRIVNFQAVYEHRNQIILWGIIGNPVYSYNYATEKWIRFGSQISTVPIMCYHMVVVEDVLFWHYCGHIYSYHLIKNEWIFLYQLENSKLVRVKPYYRGYYPDCSFLVPVGKEKLCLICWDGEADNKLHCYRFRITKSLVSEEGSGIGLVFDGFGDFHTPGGVIGEHVLVV